MALTSIVFNIKQDSATTIRVTEEYTDSITGLTWKKTYVADNGHDTEAQRVINLARELADLAEQEINRGIQSFIDGDDPLHDGPEPNGPFTNIVPDYVADWDTYAAAIMFHFLEDEDRNVLHHIETTIIRVSGQDKRRILDCTNQQVSGINGEIQTAVVAVADLNTYTPLAVEGVVQ